VGQYTARQSLRLPPEVFIHDRCVNSAHDFGLSSLFVQLEIPIAGWFWQGADSSLLGRSCESFTFAALFNFFSLIKI
jgi:hypothetical protein